MKVQELIDKLNELPDKDIEVKIYVAGQLSGILEIDRLWTPTSKDRYYIRTKNPWRYDDE